MSKKRRVPTLATIIQYSFRSPNHCNQKRKINKRVSDWKEKVMLSLFADDMILHKEYPKDGTKILLELINEFSEVMG